MNCPGCAHQIPASVKFCPECGARIGARCAACGAELLPGAKFCAECGVPQARAGGAPPERSPREYTPKHLARALGDEAGWERELREALRIYTAMDATGWMERIAEELAS